METDLRGMETYRTVSPIGFESPLSLAGDLKDRGWEWGLALEVWNVYNRDNILEVRYSPNFTKEEPISQLPIIPFIATTLEF